MTEEPNEPAPASTVEYDLPCVQCGYNLRMLPITGQCPECGMPVANTMTLNAEFARSRPKWLRGLAFGNLLLLSTRVALLMIFWMSLSTPSGGDPNTEMALCALASVFYALGTILLTRKENPFVKRPDLKFVAYQLVLSWACALCTVAAFVLLVYSMNYISAGRGLDVETTVESLFLIGWLTWCGCIVFECLFLAKLARRLIDNFLTEHCIIAGMGAAVSNLLFVFVVVSVRGSLGVAGLASLSILWLLFLLWSGFMNLYCAIRFDHKSRVAADIWAIRDRQAAASESAP